MMVRQLSTVTAFMLFAALCLADARSVAADLAVDKIPSAVRATLIKAASGASLSEHEQDHQGGKTVNIGEIPGAWAGTVTEITVAADGRQLGEKSQKAEADEKGCEQDKGGDKD